MSDCTPMHRLLGHPEILIEHFQAEGVMNLGAAYTFGTNTPPRKPYASDVSDDEWQFVLPYLTLIRLDAPQRDHDLREVFNALRWMARAGAGWRLMPHDFPPWPALYQQMQHWLNAEVFETIAHDLRVLLRLTAGRDREPSAAIFDARTLQSTPESGGRAGYDGYKRKRGSKVHLAVNTLGHLLALYVTPANVRERAVESDLAAQVQEETGDHVTLACVDQGYSGEETANDAQAHGITLEVVKLPEAKYGFVLLPKRWVVERGCPLGSIAWMSRFRRLARDDERLPQTLAGLHLVAFVILMLQRLSALNSS